MSNITSSMCVYFRAARRVIHKAFWGGLNKAFVVLLALFLLVGLVPLPAATAAPGSGNEISIIFTHDLHAHFDPDRYEENGVPATRGGFARMMTVIDDIKSEYPGSFLFDAGDFAMGTLYQTIFSTDAAELRMLGLMGFDATTLGNHEFDYRTQGLTDMLSAALASGDPLPLLTSANINWEATFADAALKDKATALKAVLESYGNADYQVIERDGIKLAVFGLLGRGADSYAPMSGLIFQDYIDAAKAVVARIEAETDADIIVCLSHSGTSSDPSKSEDELLAAAVPAIDVIISGHTHTYLYEPIVVGNTYIVSSGEHGYALGHLTLKPDGDRYKVVDYELIPISDNLSSDPAIEASILEFRETVNETYLAQFGYQFEQEIAYSPFSFASVDVFGKVQGEEPLGNLISDAYVYAVEAAEGSSYVPVDVAVVPYGVIRGSFSEGPITVSDAYNISSLGIGPDGVPGYPLVSIYLTGAELKTMAEVDISVSALMHEARLYASGISWTYNPHRLILNRVVDVQLVQPDGSLTELDDNTLYRVIGGLYSCQMLGTVEAQSFGLLKIVPKDAAGNPILDFEQFIVYDHGRELKEWVALADYLSSFEAKDDIPQIPEYYNQLHDRKILVDSTSLGDLLKAPNKIFFIVVGVVAAVLAIVISITVLIVRAVRKARRRHRRKNKLIQETVTLTE